ncbi:hypothetical protein KIN_12580 [Litoreibacter roseus]|uniref:Uncharacterized protein n=2 Tax=Litoreibacter roseus TaxID=2601869 RepID=A0A6N6JDH8_9RHOB|nr:hypothetical protein KIN_12580 [Litoreibacter roseus]
MAAMILLTGQIYLAVGALVALPFLVVGLGRIDENAQNTWVFRPMLIPGVLLIWPLVLWRWIVLETGRADEPARHRPPLTWQPRLTLTLAVLLPFLIFAALVIRQDGPFERPAVQLEDGL